jgi:hypothetical protein
MRTEEEKRVFARAMAEYTWQQMTQMQKMRDEIKERLKMFDASVAANTLHRDCPAFHAYVKDMGLASWIDAETARLHFQPTTTE